MSIPISKFLRSAKSNKNGGMNVLADLDQISTFYPAGMRVTKTTPKSVLLAEDPRSHFNGKFWEVYPLATTPTNVYIVCPYCKMIHIHGNKAGDYEGCRTPHCFAKGYYRIMKINRME